MTRVLPLTSDNVRAAAAALRAGELVAFPTETVYGLGADARNPDAVARIFRAKGRPAGHPLIVHLPAGSEPDEWALDVPQEAHDLAAAFWPGPLTLVLRRRPWVPDQVTGGQDTVGLRVPAAPAALELLAAFGGGVAAPSANRFGRISPTRAEDVLAELGDGVAVILDGGPTTVGIESTIVDLTGPEPRLLRPGGAPRAAVEEVLGRPLAAPRGAAPRAPGTLASHYAPATPARLVAPVELERLLAAGAGEPAPAVIARRPAPAGFAGAWRELPRDSGGYARLLYRTLRELDGRAPLILIEAPPEGPEWEAVNDRLRRATFGAG